MWLELNYNVYVCVYVSEWFRAIESEWHLVYDHLVYDVSCTIVTMIARRLIHDRSGSSVSFHVIALR